MPIRANWHKTEASGTVILGRCVQICDVTTPYGEIEYFFDTATDGVFARMVHRGSVSWEWCNPNYDMRNYKKETR